MTDPLIQTQQTASAVCLKEDCLSETKKKIANNGLKPIVVCVHVNEVAAYSGYKANERPLSFTIDDQRLEVRDIVSRWAEPEKDFFKVIADDDRVYTLSWNRKSDLWLIENE